MNHKAVVPEQPRHPFRDRPRVVSLYAGCGGLDIGFTWAGYDVVWANDVDPVALETHAAVLPSHRVSCGDITQIADRPGRHDADIVIGGPPCQGFSVAGRMDPSDPRSRHIRHFLGVVKDVQPAAFVMENVKALAVSHRWAPALRSLRLQAHVLGYATELHLLNAADHGVPQARERMFLVGIKRSHGHHRPVPADTAGGRPALRTALGRLPRYGEPGNDSLCTAKITMAQTPVLRRSPWAGMLFNGAGRPMDLDRPAPTLPASMGGNRTPIIDQEQLDDGAEPWVVAYHQYLWDGGDPLPEVPSRLRRLTVEEAAAIQTFPIGMQFAGRTSAQFRQIGNAVPPELAFRVALSLRSSLGLDLLDLLPPHQSQATLEFAP